MITSGASYPETPPIDLEAPKAKDALGDLMVVPTRYQDTVASNISIADFLQTDLPFITGYNPSSKSVALLFSNLPPVTDFPAPRLIPPMHVIFELKKVLATQWLNGAQSLNFRGKERFPF